MARMTKDEIGKTLNDLARTISNQSPLSEIRQERILYAILTVLIEIREKLTEED